MLFDFDEKTTAKPLKFKDGKFRIIHITDTHLDDDNIEQSVFLIEKSCEREKPDLAVITGDNVSNEDDSSVTKGYIDKLMSVFDKLGIPAAVTFGNHDSETGSMSREELMVYYNTHKSSISVDDGEELSGCGTYNIPVLSQDGNSLKFNIWIFDSHDYEDNYYANVFEDQVKWYKEKSDSLRRMNGGEKVYSLAFQHIIVPEIYEALKKTDRKKPYAFRHMYNKDEYYMFDAGRKNYGTLNETPCCGYYNHGQFAAMVEKGDVKAIFTGHDHTNAFGVEYKGIDILNSLSTRFNGDAFSTQYGYRIIDIDENKPSEYKTYVMHWFDLFSRKEIKDLKAENPAGYKTAKEVTLKGMKEKFILKICRGFARLFTGRKISYAD